MKKAVLFFSIFFTLLTGLPHQGYSFADGSEKQDTLVALEDTYLYQGDATSNAGTLDKLVVKSTGNSTVYNRLTLLKFDLSGIDTAKGRITKAYLQLHLQKTDGLTSSVKRENLNKTPYIVGYLRDNSWQETTATWSNYADIASTNSTISTKYGSELQYVSSLQLVENQPVNWEITDRVTARKMEKKLLSLTVYSSPSSANMGANFYAKEYAGPGADTLHPRLIIVQDSDQSFSTGLSSALTVYDSIMMNIRTVLYNNVSQTASLDDHVENDVNTIGTDGSWPDIDYSSRDYTNWKPANHLTRLKDMALAYTMPNSAYYQNEDLYQDILHGMQYWYDKDPRSDNWYMQQISSPQKVGEILILMREGLKEIPVRLELELLGRMAAIGGTTNQAGSKGMGANKLNIAIHWIYRGCLSENKQVLDRGVEEAFYPLFFTTGEGLQYDYSYQQHGNQLYIGGYGWDFINGESSVALYTVGTSYALTGDRLALLSKYTRFTYLRAIRGSYFLFNVLGRSISRIGKLNQAGFVTQLNRMKKIDPTYATEYVQAIARLSQDKPAGYKRQQIHTHYFKSDYTLHTQASYSFDVRTVSTRTLRNENGNGENITGYFLSDGATDIAVDGDEYFNIFPVWDWSMIPGVTSRHLPMNKIPVPTKWGTSGNTTFVGGVSDSLHGVSVYDMNNNSTQAKKSWFFFGNEVVCLGAGITSSGAEEVNTTVNQSLLTGPVMVSSGGTVKTYTGNSTSLSFNNNLNWVLQGKVGYVFPKGGEVQLKTETRTGNWQTINTPGESLSVTKDVFTLWFEHGVKPDKDKYAYIVVPDVSTESEMQNYITADQIVIPENDNQIQAVYHKGLNLWQMVFYEPQSVFQNDSIKISADIPCLLMLQQMPDHKILIHAADPSQTQSSITISVKWPGFKKERKRTITLPSAPYLGESASIILSDVDEDNIESAEVATDTIIAVADAYVRGGSYASNNYGSDDLQIKDDASSGFIRKSYLKFNVNNLSFKKEDIQSVKLYLNVRSAGSSVPSNPFFIHYVNDNNWEENTITWNNKPSVEEQLAVAFGKLSDSMYWDITPKVSELLDENKETVSLLAESVAPNPSGNANGWITLYSRETAETETQKPRLIITYKDIVFAPEIDSFKAGYTISGVVLNWKTKHEHGISKFVVGRGTDGNHFQNLSDIQSKGESPVGFNYSFEDKNLPEANAVYYQIYALNTNNDTIAISDVAEVKIMPAPEVISTDLTATAEDGDKVKLNWTVSKEVNIGRYEIEKSTDGVTFDKIADVTAAGSGDYSYEEENVPAGIYNYRWRAIDHDGHIVTSSNTVEVKITEQENPENETNNEQEEPQLLIYPNPVTAGSVFTLRTHHQTAGDILIQLANSRGQIVRTINRHVSAGTTGIEISTAGLSGGLYFVRVINRQDSSIQKTKMVIE